MVNETAFEFLPLHTVTLLFPMAPETEVSLTRVAGQEG
jgi:hypothetical protein